MLLALQQVISMFVGCSFKLLKGEGKISELNIAETLKDVRRALLDADVNTVWGMSFIVGSSVYIQKLDTDVQFLDTGCS